MSNRDANREMKAKVAETLLSAEDALKILKDDDGARIHYQLLRWLIPQAEKTLRSLRKGDHLTDQSEQMYPVQALAIVVEHFDFLVQEAIDDMDDEEYERLMSMFERGV